MDGSCWDRFGRKTLLTFTGYKDCVPGVMSELDRIGMKDVNVQWQFPNPFESVLLRDLRHEKCLSAGYMNASMGHYSAIKTAYHLGMDSCIVIEDDICFLKDLDKIASVVKSLPEDFDIALFDMFLLGLGESEHADYLNAKKNRKINDEWAEYDNLRSQGCYAMSRKAMERYIWLNEVAVTDHRIGKLRIGDHFLARKYMGKDMKLYFSVDHIAIQRSVGSSNTNATDPYEGMDVDINLYGGA